MFTSLIDYAIIINGCALFVKYFFEKILTQPFLYDIILTRR